MFWAMISKKGGNTVGNGLERDKSSASLYSEHGNLCLIHVSCVTSQFSSSQHIRGNSIGTDPTNVFCASFILVLMVQIVHTD